MACRDRKPWLALGGPFFFFLHKCVLFSPCKSFISATVGSFQSGQAFASQKALTIEGWLCGQSF